MRVLIACLLILFAVPAFADEPKTLTWDDLLPEGEAERLEELWAQDTYLLHDTPESPYGGSTPVQLGTYNVVDELEGQQVKIPGFILPFEYVESGKISEFLLVPYFGACIHSPPPPPNQIVFVTAEKALDIGQMWDPIWVLGTLRTTRHYNDLGTRRTHWRSTAGRSMMVTRLLATLATSVVFCAAALAQDDAHDHHDTHHEDEAHHADEDQTRASGSAHVHGAWTLFAALDDDLLSVTMTGPLQDVLGFESAPETPRQHAAVEAMLQDLSRADALIATDPGAQCEPSAPVDIGLPEDFNVLRKQPNMWTTSTMPKTMVMKMTMRIMGTMRMRTPGMKVTKRATTTRTKVMTMRIMTTMNTLKARTSTSTCLTPAGSLETSAPWRLKCLLLIRALRQWTPSF